VPGRVSCRDPLRRLYDKDFPARLRSSARTVAERYIDLIFLLPINFPARRRSRRRNANLRRQRGRWPRTRRPMDKELKRRLAAIAKLSPGDFLLEDKGYSLGAFTTGCAACAGRKAILRGS